MLRAPYLGTGGCRTREHDYGTDRNGEWGLHLVDRDDESNIRTARNNCLEGVRSNHGINVFFVYILTQDSSSGTSRVAIVADSECIRFVIRMCAARSLARQIARGDESYKFGLIRHWRSK
jgi:hypothetical protein